MFQREISIFLVAGLTIGGCAESTHIVTHQRASWNGASGRGTVSWIEPETKPGERQQLDSLLRTGMSEKAAMAAIGLEDENPNPTSSLGELKQASR